jgi:hypothetical protein
MSNVNTSLLQRNISKVLPNKAAAILAELVLLFLLGSLAVVLHAKLRIPMHLPGKHGLIFMFVIMISRSVSGLPFAASFTCLGSSSVLLINGLGFHDPFIFVAYFILGIIMDILFAVTSPLHKNIAVLALTGAVSWAMLPVLRYLLSFFTGYLDPSLMTGPFYSLATHLVFGFAGSILGLLLINILRRK